MSGEGSVLSDVVYWLLWVVVWVAPGLVTAMIAHDRGRPVWRWLVVGLIFSWLSLIAIIVLPDKSGQPHVSVQEWEEEQAQQSAAAGETTEEPSEAVDERPLDADASTEQDT